MTSAFTFAFSGDDIDIDDATDAGNVGQSKEASLAHKAVVPANKHAVEELVSLAGRTLQILEAAIWVGIITLLAETSVISFCTNNSINDFARKTFLLSSLHPPQRAAR